MITKIKKHIYHLTLASCFLFAPIIQGAQGAFDDEKSPDTSDHYTISNALVLLVGIDKYSDCTLDDLENVGKDMEVLHELFATQCDYEVRNTYHDGPSQIGRAVTKEELDNFIFNQYTYLRTNRKLYDALIFAFIGHGGGNYNGNDCIFTSDGKKTLFSDIEGQFTRKADDTFLEDFVKKPKIFFKLACRNQVPDLVKTTDASKAKKWRNICSEVIIFHATSPGYSMPDVSKFVSSFSHLMSQSLGKKQLDLLDIDRKLKQQVYENEVLRSEVGLTKKIFFSPKRPPLDKETEAAWWQAIKTNQLDEVKEILTNYKVDLNKPDKDGWTPLLIAAAKNSKDVVELLIKGGAELNKAKENGYTPIYIAAQNNSKDVAELLIKGGAELNKARDTGATPLYIAAF